MIAAMRKRERGGKSPSTLLEVEERLHEAIRTLAALPDRERRFIYARQTSWPETLREAIDVIALALERIQQGKPAYVPLREPRYVPTKEAIDRMDEALDWLAWLDERGLNLVTLRAFRTPWIKIAWRYGRSDTTVQRWYKEALESVLQRLVLPPAASV